jgi:hypothetical protein
MIIVLCGQFPVKERKKEKERKREREKRRESGGERRGERFGQREMGREMGRGGDMDMDFISAYFLVDFSMPSAARDM